MLTKVWSSLLKIGVTKASFQAVDRKEELKDLMDNGTLSCCPHSLRDKIGQPSGPDALDGLKVDKLRYTSCGVNSISASGSTTWGKYNGSM